MTQPDPTDRDTATDDTVSEDNTDYVGDPVLVGEDELANTPQPDDPDSTEDNPAAT